MILLKIQWAFGFLFRHAFNSVGVDHGRSDVAVAKKFLNRPNVVIGLKQVTGEAVTEGVG